MMTLPTDSAARKEYPMYRGLLRYFPAALAGVARHSKLGNDKHNPGEEMHHARGKSSDHADCIMRHLIDLSELMALPIRTPPGATDGNIDPVSFATAGYMSELDACAALLTEANALAWRALALSQEMHERYGNAPLAPGAKL